MNTGRAIYYILAIVLILIGLGLAVIIGLSFISVALQTGTSGRLITGIVFLAIGLLMMASGGYLIYSINRSKAGAVTQNVTYKVDLPANVNLDTLKCKSCGGSLTMDNIEMVAGAPVVHCPYCGSVYQLTEEPKW
jgi:hypothetical protein